MAVGSATILSDTVGTITTDRYLAAELKTQIPFAFIFSDTAQVTTDPTLQDLALPEAVESMTLFIDYLSPFNFGVDLHVFSMYDTLDIPDTLITFFLEPYNNQFPSGRLDSILLKQEQIDWLVDPVYLQTQIDLIGPSEESGETARLFSTDSLNVLLFGALKIYVNEPSDE